MTAEDFMDEIQEIELEARKTLTRDEIIDVYETLLTMLEEEE